MKLVFVKAKDKLMISHSCQPSEGSGSNINCDKHKMCTFYQIRGNTVMNRDKQEFT